MRVAPPLSNEERFWARVDKDCLVLALRPDLGSCWEWTGRIQDGYGVFDMRPKEGGRNYRAVGAHTFTTPNCPEGFERDHLCRNRACVRPSHIEFVTKRVNIDRGNLKKERCKHGHRLEGNVREKRNARGWLHRWCLTCERNHNEAMRRERASRRGALRSKV